ncbi:hypothetical protein [Nocardia cyriacigeorgica]|uniref:hypothetical protein n=1 Tax=Nocardia cyriacigeorgica TaxID=135487 RepID=UPI0024558926|nr:hypothetical protein [Nocardia cyriacigeorgica]
MTSPDSDITAWVEWHTTGMWAPLYADGFTGDPMTHAEMLDAIAEQRELEAAAEPAGLGRPVIDVDPLYVNDREEVKMYILEPGPEGACSDEPQVERDRP